MQFTETDVRNGFEAGTFARGERYFQEGNVLDLQEEGRSGRRLWGLVSGRGDLEYDVSIEYTPRGRRLFRCQCSCPVGHNCKHAVAVLLMALREENESDWEYQSWLSRWEQAQAAQQRMVNTASNGERIAFSLSPVEGTDPFTSLLVQPGIQRPLKRGGMSKLTAKSAVALLTPHYREALDADAKTILQLLLSSTQPYQNSNTYLYSELHQQALERMLASQRVFWQQEGQPLRLGPARTLAPQWHEEEGRQVLDLRLQDGGSWSLIPFASPWYVDHQNLCVGPLDTGLNTAFLYSLQQLPALPAEAAQHFGEQILAPIRRADLPSPVARAQREISTLMIPRLQIRRDGMGWRAELGYGYGEITLNPALRAQPELRRFELEGQSLWLERDIEAELESWQAIERMGLEALPSEGGAMPFASLALQPSGARHGALLGFWRALCRQWYQSLTALGWQLDWDPQLLLEPIEVLALDVEIEEQDHWFDLGLAVELQGERIPLLPLLIQWLQLNDDWETARADLVLEREQGAPLKISYDSLKPVLRLLSELGQGDGETLRLENHQAAVLTQLPEVNRWIGGSHVQTLAQKLKDFDGIRPVAVPAGLQATLRDYQRRGLDWLGFLHEYGFGGVLADDMGLGKTMQTLAHLLRLKAAGSLAQPALLICPTSLVGNWQREAASFAPELRVLVLHGSQRHAQFDRIDDADLVITTYPLISRDIDQLEAWRFSLAILDEAQTIKTPTAKMTLAIKQLNAGQRLCLTGTPMENHLGELWSLFDFLMPGFLGTLAEFNKQYRHPIEKLGNHEARQRLMEKIRPFLLRRTKDQVATELPAKTEIIQRIALPNAQRTLYEAVRAMMEQHIRELLASKGLAKSRIEFLDALLKLRQICCAPQLLKLEQAQAVKESAKLDFLMEQLPEMVEEGRRVLIFSQFTQMLALIEQRLQSHGIDYSKLTGQTRKRQQAIDAFQEGEVPVFLISLKAGGTGLNLTQADTVIHVDPWWNPAAEAQATDRAYRIGQDKPVFVYKLICEQTIEERVLEMQQRKQALADSVYGDPASPLASLESGDELLALFREA
ncbi:DEAD/DEAH box helicase [Ferrimonas pelagia]|uniref:DEAD/DEAH box helicase n=1 Tax=Ferrimonas pelagia TaxID=1177826 RepID=UPI0031F09055